MSKPTLKTIVKMLVEIETDYKDVTLATAGNMVRIAQGVPGNYIIFQNRRGEGPAIWRSDNDIGAFAEKIQAGKITGMVKQDLYAYAVDGQETVLALPRRDEDSDYICWYRRDDVSENSPWSEFEQ